MGSVKCAVGDRPDSAERGDEGETKEGDEVKTVMLGMVGIVRLAEKGMG